MALECTLMIETHQPIPMTAINANAIPKGSVCMLSDPYTAEITTGDIDSCAGIAAKEKIASDGTTKLAVYRGGIFKGYAGAAGVTAGMAIVTDTATGAANELVVAGLNAEHIVGTALETATDGQTFLFELNPFGIQLA